MEVIRHRHVGSNPKGVTVEAQWPLTVKPSLTDIAHHQMSS